MRGRIVHRVEEGMDRQEILCTTYQMRTFYRQMGDGYFTNLDVMNYIQHLRAVQMMKPGWKVLDVCCGRGLLLPLIRWYRKDIGEYVGVDICDTNVREAQTRTAYARRLWRVVRQPGVDTPGKLQLPDLQCRLCEALLPLIDLVFAPIGEVAKVFVYRKL
jgi:SAM-dependent methyltransferase